MISPLKDKIIYVSRPESESLGILTDSGARLVFAPAIETSPIADNPALEEAAGRIGDFDYIIFTSANSVIFFSELTAGKNLDLSKSKIAALGDKTSAVCRNHGYNADLVPDDFSAAGLLVMFEKLNVGRKNFLIPCSDMSRDELSEGLRKLKAFVTRVPVYKTICVPDTGVFASSVMSAGKKPDIFIFTSPSSFDCFCRLMNIADTAKYFSDSLVAAIGKTTGESIQRKGIHNVLTPSVFTLEAVAELIADHFAEIK